MKAKRDDDEEEEEEEEDIEERPEDMDIKSSKPYQKNFEEVREEVKMFINENKNEMALEKLNEYLNKIDETNYSNNENLMVLF